MPRRDAVLICVTTLCGSALLAGCSGSGSSLSNTARVRAITAISNGGSATISVNGSAVVGSQNYFGVSAYQSQNTGSASVTFSLSANSGTTYPSLTQTFSSGTFYSLILVGRSDITSPTDPRYPAILPVSDLLTTPSTSQASLRVINAAPDAGNVDVLVNSSAALSAGAYKAVGGYVNEPSGNVNIQVNQAGTNTILVTAQAVSLTSGHAYTVYVLEPTVSTSSTAASYGIQESDDTASAITLN